MATESGEDVLLRPCPWCDSTDIRLYTSCGKEHAQCHDCTACGPDHIEGRHWNRLHQPPERPIECSGDSASCPENEGYGCCKPNPEGSR